ncbi:MAG: phosphoribosylformylglycinamidine cyclo-ligase [Clostridia bacterium]|nr:phosphoribosylformylglycinamidine cyclo-ligase [Clostridia bacterium]MBQ6172395.1 phosphoribosylformylglycinamidine cyclo-ligase [Clostridia bacterium]
MNESSHSASYAAAGVDVTAGYKSVELMKKFVKSTYNAGVLQDIGGFGGLFKPDMTGIEEPVLVSGTDGVGTKLKIAFLLDKHDTVGIDCVAMCVNDIICCGASPLLFLDYIATGKLIPEKIAEIVKGVSDGCILSGAALIGGETAEMPGFYSESEYDLAGFAVGMVDKKNIIDGSAVSEGDALIGIASSGVHSNGFSLVRKVFSLNDAEAEKSLSVYSDELGKTLGEALLTPTEIYVKTINEIKKSVKINAISHITGGGFYENMPRMLPEGISLEIDAKSFPVPPIFSLLQKCGDIPERDMFNTYNMGIGMALLVSEKDAAAAVASAKNAGKDAYVIGRAVKGEKKVIFR